MKHIGPTAQDFRAVFGLGNDDTTISTIDPSGIALAGVQELARENKKLREEIADLRADVEAFKGAIKAQAGGATLRLPAVARRAKMGARPDV